MQVDLDIVTVHLDPLAAQRLKSGRYRVNAELNDEWIDIQNNGAYVLNMQGRILAAIQHSGRCSRSALVRSATPIPLHPGEKIRIFTGEQPRQATHIADGDLISRVLWLVQPTYLWGADTHEARVYFSMADLNQQRPPLSRLICL